MKLRFLIRKSIYILRSNTDVKKYSFDKTIGIQKMPSFSFHALQLIRILFLMCDNEL